MLPKLLHIISHKYNVYFRLNIDNDMTADDQARLFKKHNSSELSKVRLEKCCDFMT